MFRSAATRGVVRSLNAAAHPAFRTARAPLRSQLCAISRQTQHAQTAKPLALGSVQLVRQVSSTCALLDKIDHKHEAEVAKQKLEPHPELVSTQSSIHPVLGEVGTPDEPKRDVEMLGGVKHDLGVIRDTFSLEDVPKEAYYIGLAGVIPYVATSAGTVYCAWEIHHVHTTGSSFLMNDKTAELLLHVLEPLQVGYGATIISFLGAIHWGLEFAKYGGSHGYHRYAVGMVAAGLAWPTILLPVETALISQFLLFTGLYYRDSRSAKRGWAPPWYGVYRFVLTFIVGSSIVVSLIGRGHVSDRVGRATGPSDRIRKLRDSQTEQLEEEEGARRKYLAEADEEEEEDEEEEKDEEKEGGEDEEEEDKEEKKEEKK